MWNTKRSGWLQKAILALLLGLSCLRLGAQVDVPADLQDDDKLPREERLRRHMLRLQKIVADAQAHDAQMKKDAGQTQQQTAAQMGVPLPGLTAVGPQPTPAVVGGPPAGAPPGAMPAVPPGAVPPGVAPPPIGQPGGVPPGGVPFGGSMAPTAQAVPFRISRAIVYLYPFQVLSRVGDMVETGVWVFNSTGGPYDQIALHLKYDPLVLAPERVNDGPIYKLLTGAPKLRVNQSKGELYYAARLRQAITKTTATLVTIQWRALNPVYYSEIGFGTGDNETRIGREDRNILGFTAAGRREGGTLPGIVMVAPRENSLRQIIPPFGEIVVANINEFVTLHLESDSETVAKGEEWIVSLALRNAAAVPFNDLCVHLFFDPAKLQLVDWHQGNWIRQGINIYDGFAHDAYRFDVFRANSADNERGEVLYRVGSRAAQMFPSGVFAKIKFKALADASLSDVWFDFEDRSQPAGTAETDVTFLGSSVMFAPRRKVEAEQRPAPESLRRPGT
jgi:hypothetical protein